MANLSNMLSLLLLPLGVFLTVLGTGFVLVRVRAVASFARANGCEKPTSTYPHSPYLLGLDYVFSQAINIRQRRFAEGVADLFRQLGPTWTAKPFGKPVIHTIDPENLRALMQTRCDDYAIVPARQKLVDTLYGSGIFAHSGHEWRYSRALSRQALGRMTYDDAVFQQHADRLVADVRSAGDGREVEFAGLAYGYTSDVAADFYLGESRRSIDPVAASRASTLHEHFTALGVIGRTLTLFGKRIPYVVRFFYPDYKTHKRTVESIIDGRLAASISVATDDKAEKTQTRTTLARAFAESTNDLQRARTELANLLLAGNDTVAIGLSELMWYLARHPSVWDKLRAEALDVLSVNSAVRRATVADVKRCEYLRCVINEGLRLRPTLSVHGRMAKCDTVLPRGGGVDGNAPMVVPKGAYVLYSNYALHRNPAVFGADVDDFRPERWLGEAAPSVVGLSIPALQVDSAPSSPTRRPSLPLLRPGRYEYLPFGAGPRACPGEKLGANAVALAVLALVTTFERVRPADQSAQSKDTAQDDWQEAMAFSFFNRHGVRVVFERPDAS